MPIQTREEFSTMLSLAGVTYRIPRKPARYLSRPEFADRIGVTRGAMNRYILPPPDAFIGELPGWTVATIDAWHSARRSQRDSK